MSTPNSTVDTSDFTYDIGKGKVEDIGAQDDGDDADDIYTDVDSYEGNKNYAIMNLKKVIGKLEESLDVSIQLGRDSNNTAALGKIGEIARIYMDANIAVVDISRKDVEMKEEKEKAKAQDDPENGGLSTRDIIRALREEETAKAKSGRKPKAAV